MLNKIQKKQKDRSYFRVVKKNFAAKTFEFNLPESFVCFFTSTSIPWILILCIILYRHDLSQIIYPFKDRYSIREWKLIFQHLGIPFDVPSKSGKTGRDSRIQNILCHTLEQVLERYPNMEFYIFDLTIVTGLSLLFSIVIVPLLAGWSSRFATIIAAGFQITSAFPSVFAFQRFFGPFPSAHYKYNLKKNRLGSLMRYEDALVDERRKM